MIMHKVDAKMEAGEPPTPGIIQNMGKFIGGLLKSGVFKDGAGLHRSAKRARVSFAGGQPSVERGPYAGNNELLASFAMVSTGVDGSIEKAIDLAIELGRAAGDRDVEIGPLVEGWDLHGGERPAGKPHRFLLFLKADAAFEAGAAQPAAVQTLLDRWKQDGILESAATLKPSKTAARTRVVGGQRRWIDGPFAESKELVAGFSILEVPSLDEAKRLTEEYVGILGDNECDVREVA